MWWKYCYQIRRISELNVLYYRNEVEYYLSCETIQESLKWRCTRSSMREVSKKLLLMLYMMWHIMLCIRWTISSWIQFCHHGERWRKEIFEIFETLPFHSFNGNNAVDEFINTRRKLVNLTHWGRVTHICVNGLATIGSDNGLSPGRRQAIIWNNAGLLLMEQT